MPSLLALASGADRACLLASSSPASGAWLHALPSANIGFRLSDQELRVSVGLCLGDDVVSCWCTLAAQQGFRMDIMACRVDGVQVASQDIMRSMMFLHALSEALASLPFLSLLRGSRIVGLLRGDGKKPDVRPSFPGPEVVQ